MTSFHYIVKAVQGLHMRPAGLLARRAEAYPCKVTLEKEGKAPANAKSVFGIMGLSVRQGEQITVCCDGECEAQAARELEDFLQELL